jgi:hypothetical protein
MMEWLRRAVGDATAVKTVVRTSGPEASVQGGKHDAPGSYVFASTTGRAVSPR